MKTKKNGDTALWGFFSVAGACALVLGLAGCADALHSDNAKSGATSYLVSVSLGGAGAKSSKGLIDDTNVKSVTVSVFDASGNAAGAGGTLKPKDGYWGGDISVPAGFLTFAASAYDARSVKLYYGEARQMISGSGARVTIGVTAPASSIAMVEIPAGTFTMGDSDNGTFTCTLSAFRMSKYDITQSQYQAITGTNPSDFSGNSDAASCPVEQVTWYDAVEFCNKLSTQDGLTPVYTITGRTPSDGSYPITSATVSAAWGNTGYRLPTEAQWEYAARAGTTSTYYWGEASDDTTVGQYAWFSSNSNATHAVGQKLPNKFGLYDMAGNVLQWCWDWYDSYPSGSPPDPTGPSSGSNRVIRGGSWDDSSFILTSACRGSSYPSEQFDYFGFRVCAP